MSNLMWVAQTTAQRQQQGVTLVEMTMVLVILGLLLGGLMTPLATQLESHRRWETKRDLEKINDALIGHFLVHGYLPCPDNKNDGREGRDATGCAGTSVAAAKSGRVWLGTIPWVTLGVGERDAWNNRFTYAVTDLFTDASHTPLPAISLETAGNIQVTQGVDATPAVIVSHGANGLGAMSVAQVVQGVPVSPAELENSNGDARFAYAPYHNDSNQGFDDQLTWISPYVLKNRLIQAGRLVR